MGFELYNQWFKSLSYEDRLEVLQDDFDDAVKGSIIIFEHENAVRMLPVHLRQVYEESLQVEISQFENGYSNSRQTLDIASENLNIPRELLVELMKKASALIDDMLEENDHKD
jgi:hypothetical protein